MPGHDLRALDTLRVELKFLDLGLYRAPTPGRPLFVLEDSPTCPWYGAATSPNCVLMQFVPSECRSEPVPCHHIPFSRDQFGLSLPVTGTKNAQESHC